VYLPEDRWHGEIGHRRVQMVLKDGTSFLQLVADNGKLTAEVKALSTKIEDLEAANEDLKVEIKDLKVEIKDQKVEVKDQKVEIKDLIEKDVVKATKIENLEATNKDLTDDRDQRRLLSREQRTLMILKDLIDASGARQVEGKFSSFNSLVVHRNNNAHFLRMGPKPLRDPTALLEYTQKREDHDSRAVLCAKLKMVRDFVQQGLPEVRMSGRRHCG
jgi:cell division protein FtsB